MPLQFTPIVLGTVVVVGLGMLLYSMYTNSSRPQAHGPHGRRRRSKPDDDDNYNNFGLCSRSIKCDEDKKLSDKSNYPRKHMNLTECTICTSFVRQNRKQLTCGHIFHNHCIVGWCRNNNTCPNCRAYVNL